MDRINFMVCMYKGQDMDAALDDLKTLVNGDLQTKWRRDGSYMANVETSLDNFEAAFGTRPPYSEEKGWQYENGEPITVPKSLDQKIEAVELSLKLYFA